MASKLVYIYIPKSNLYIDRSDVSGGIFVIELFAQAFERKGFECILERSVTPSVKHILAADLIIVPSEQFKILKDVTDLCKILKKSYLFIPFYEEKQWQADAMLFFQQAFDCCKKKVVLENYDVYAQRHLYIRSQKILKRPVFENAIFNFVNSRQEDIELKKDYPNVVTERVQLSCGIVDKHEYAYSPQFLKKTGLRKGEFILQVGRIALRKNQIASVLATMNLKIPLVFVFTNYNPTYFTTLLEIVSSHNKSMPIFLITPINIKVKAKNIVVIQTDISNELLISAYQNAGLQLHPAFYECPGYTYLEAAKLAIPTVASSRSTLREYLFDENGNFAFDEGIDFVRPDDVEAITKSVKAMFGKKFKRPDLPIFRRTEKDVRDEMGLLIDRYLK